MKRSQKAIALLLSLLMAVSLLPLSAAAAIRVNNTFAAGTYTGTVNFYAVTNPKPVFYMQDMDATKLAQLMPDTEDTVLRSFCY